nr:MAG TPA: hypothetical protein [Crassvirales sp.]
MSSISLPSHPLFTCFSLFPVSHPLPCSMPFSRISVKFLT